MLNKNIHIVGLSGAEGAAISKFLVKKGYRNITAHDFCTEQDFAKNIHLYHQEYDRDKRVELLKEIKNLPIQVRYKDEYLKGIDEADTIYLPQSWYLYSQNNPIKKEIERGVEIQSLMHLYLNLGNATKIGVTGSNGKTTTTNLIYKMLKADNKNVYLVGNDRKNEQLLDELEDMTSEDFLVIEISNRHLKMNYEKSPHISIITNISQNHLGEHIDFEDYRNTKYKIFEKQNKNDVLIIRESDFKNIKNDVKSKVIFYDSKDKIPSYIEWGQVRLKGDHNKENILAAISVAKEVNISDEVIEEVLYSFQGVSKRMEEIGNINGLLYVNDLSSTTPESTILAIDNYKSKPITLIIGGENKNLDLQDLVRKINADVNNVIYHSASLSDGIILHLNDNVKIHESERIEETIKKADQVTSKGGVVLFSPVGEGFISGILKNRKLKKLIEDIIEK